MEEQQYSHGYDESVLSTYRTRSVVNSAAYLLPHLNSDLTLLDVGCGPGSISADFADRLYAGQVCAVDVSSASIGQAQRDFHRDNLQFQTASVYALPFADEQFDVVHAHQVLQHLSEPLLVLQEMRRVLKPLGLLALRDTTYATMWWQPKLPALQRWMDLYQAIAKRSGGNPNIGEDLSTLLQQYHWQSIEVSTSNWDFIAADGSAKWWGESWSQRVVQSDFGKHAIEYGWSDIEELKHLSREWLDWSQLPNAEFHMCHHQLLARK